MQRAISSRTRASLLSSPSTYPRPLSRARQGAAIATGLQQQRYAHKVRLLPSSTHESLQEIPMLSLVLKHCVSVLYVVKFTDILHRT